MPFEAVIKLMVCADRFMVVFVRRLAEHWILNALGELELQEYNLQPMKAVSVRGNGADVEVGGLTTAVLGDSKRVRADDSLMGEAGIAEKRPKLDPNGDIDLVNGINMIIPEDPLPRGRDPLVESIISSAAHSSSSKTMTNTTINSNSDENISEDNKPSPPKSPTITASSPSSTSCEDEPIAIQDYLLAVYEACSHPRLGSIYTSTHPFHALLWDTLRRMMLRMGSIAIRPHFTTMLNQGGQERMQEFLQILFELATEKTDSYLTAADL
jgi:hypothetical protein